MDEWEGSDDGLDTDEEKVTSQCTLKKHTRHVTRVRKKPFKVKTDREKQRLRWLQVRKGSLKKGHDCVVKRPEMKSDEDIVWRRPMVKLTSVCANTSKWNWVEAKMLIFIFILRRRKKMTQTTMGRVKREARTRRKRTKRRRLRTRPSTTARTMTGKTERFVRVSLSGGIYKIINQGTICQWNLIV